MNKDRKNVLAYITGVALGDGNLSNPNGRAIRLRVTCDAKYPRLAEHIVSNLRLLLPKNKVSIVKAHGKETYFNISVYSNKFAMWLPWKVGHGTKLQQLARVPSWIRNHKTFSKECLRGLLQTDGCIYKDRGYLMVNFTNYVEPLAIDVFEMLQEAGFRPTISKVTAGTNFKYCVRVARNTQKLIDTLRLFKS